MAEKLEAIVKLGTLNTRLKDYFDLLYLAKHFEFNGPILVAAIRATFERRGTPLPSAPPEGLSESFAAAAVKQTQWSAFAARQPARQLPPLPEAIAAINRFIAPPLRAAAKTEPLESTWNPTNGWSK